MLRNDFTRFYMCVTRAVLHNINCISHSLAIARNTFVVINNHTKHITVYNVLYQCFYFFIFSPLYGSKLIYLFYTLPYIRYLYDEAIGQLLRGICVDRYSF